MEILKQKTRKKIAKKILYKKNVNGFSNQLMPRLHADGTSDPNDLCIRVYVTNKVETDNLLARDVIPRDLKIRNLIISKKYHTDVVEIKELRALIDKTAKFRPVELGVSVGHYDISAGSLGQLYQKDGIVYAGSNAHVVTPDPSLEPHEIIERRICQPGPAHDRIGKSGNVAGQYAWHDRIHPDSEFSNCPVANFICKVCNGVAALLGRKTRLTTEVENINYLDFGVYEKTVPHILKVADDSIDPTIKPFVGHLYAGSSDVGIICKVKYIQDKGYNPIGAGVAEPGINDSVKGCSFWCNYETVVIDPSATVQVGYGNFVATFEDSIIVHNGNVIKGGWSGSGWYLS